MDPGTKCLPLVPDARVLWYKSLTSLFHHGKGIDRQIFVNGEYITFVQSVTRREAYSLNGSSDVFLPINISSKVKTTWESTSLLIYLLLSQLFLPCKVDMNDAVLVGEESLSSRISVHAQLDPILSRHIRLPQCPGISGSNMAKILAPRVSHFTSASLASLNLSML